VLGEIGVAFVVPADGGGVSLADLRSWATGSLADYKAPDRLAVVESLPLTSMMKVDKRALAERVDQARPVHAVQVREQ
jgi:non-ribosomal peptide synthetase component E (peptide arylation enzyme)